LKLILGPTNVENLHWAVAIRTRTSPLERELGEAVCGCLEKLGCRARLVEDGDPAGLKGEVLLLLINLDNFTAYCRQLRTAGAARPVVILWQMDPLLPEGMPPQAEAIGLKAARWKDRFRLYQSTTAMSRWEKLRTAVRLREWACKQFSAPGYRKAARLIQRSGVAGDFDWPQVRGAMGSWARIRDAHREGWVDHFVVSTDQRRRFLASRSIPSSFVPVGAYAELGRDLGRPRDIPVGFLGNIKYGRRAVLLEQLGRRLEEKGVSMARVLGNCHGEQRCEWLNRTRILVNLNNIAWNPAWIRFLLAARCGTLVVSEPMDDEHPMRPGVHYVAATPDQMPEVILQLLEDTATVSRITRAAAELCRTELTLLRALEKVRACAEAVNPAKETST